MSRLEPLVAAAREQAARRRKQMPLAELRSRLGTRGPTRSFADAVAGPGLSLIAEFKRGSPSAGEIRAGAEVAAVVGGYERAGAAAVSVLTEEEHFLGSLEDLRAARDVCQLPILRKDFVVEPYQLLESVVAGADAVLLIVAALGEEDLRALLEEAQGLDLDCLVEVHDRDELDRALETGAGLIGINNRDLRDLSVDRGLTAELIGAVPPGVTVVSESGFDRREQLEELERIGVGAVLIGESLMRADEPEAAVRELLGRADADGGADDTGGAGADVDTPASRRI